MIQWYKWYNDTVVQMVQLYSGTNGTIIQWYKWYNDTVVQMVQWNKNENPTCEFCQVIGQKMLAKHKWSSTAITSNVWTRIQIIFMTENARKLAKLYICVKTFRFGSDFGTLTLAMGLMMNTKTYKNRHF